MVKNTADETTLRKIANIGEGKFFRSINNRTLESIFEEINTLEKSKIIETTFKKTEDFYSMYLVWAIVFYGVWLLLKGTFVSTALED
jgi:Ca-activated chloride channel family protein